MSEAPSEELSSSIAANLATVRARISAACARAGRAPSDVTLLAVSKMQPPEAVRAAYAAGQRAFGENYVQELTAKSAALHDLTDLAWHMIGNVQTNKARAIAPVVACVHSIDSVKLARELGRRAHDAGRAIDALVQVHLGGAEHRAGCAPEALDEVLDAVAQEGALRLRGLMTVPPPTDDPEGACVYFEALVALRDARGGAARLPVLSMGMTHDLDVAVACGATVVRVGTAIFGARA